MNKKYYILGTALCGMLASGLTSCDNEEFLNVDQYTIIDKEAMYENDDNAKKGLNGVYDQLFPNDDYDGDWGFKPNLFTGSHPTMDTQATGWDKNWTCQKWDASSDELFKGWKHVYAGICRANDFLVGLENSTNVSESVKKHLDGEGRALRGFYYHWLATTFGRVPMLATGEDYSNTPEKARAETYEEMWDFIIDDFKAAAEELDWAPMDNQYGRATKGMALTYLGDAYMWKAYRLTTGANGQRQDEAEAKQLYQQAADCFKQVINSGTYKLNESFTTLWDPASAWGPEAIWVEQLDEGNNWGKWDNLTSKLMLKWYTACPNGNGGWGSLYLSWEWYSCFEQGDKRREGSCYTGPVPEIDPSNPKYDKKYEGWYEPSIYGINPYLQEYIGNSGEGTNEDGSLKIEDNVKHFHNGTGADVGPCIWSSKMWRTASAQYKSWGDGHWSPTPIYWKRLPNVMLDYAECLFRLEGENSAEAWKQINTLRNRAFGKLEDGNEAALTSKFLPYYNQFAEWIGRDESKYFHLGRKEYPIPFGSRVDAVPDAQTYYKQYAAEKGFTSPYWLVAINTERRKEFNCEWSLRPDMQRSGFIQDHILHNYPNHTNTSETGLQDDWQSAVDFEYDELRMDMPIPQTEIDRNSLCDQNPAYKKKE